MQVTHIALNVEASKVHITFEDTANRDSTWVKNIVTMALSDIPYFVAVHSTDDRYTVVLDTNKFESNHVRTPLITAMYECADNAWYLICEEVSEVTEV